ncbi:hypothetical protein CPB83DRAFT_900151 [Crepidotus variabilis]|uniref:Uncharacterized protein n=1 Tax=Crepidotus variabilis TaxID=179855 RepID=A0A9P6E3P4_9AGAR|nr:hypothetical protein CPB83DRAFT_900151 [Crepidotus variabilis]
MDYATLAILISTVADLSNTPGVRSKNIWREIYQLFIRNSYLNFDKLHQNKSFPRSSLRPIDNHARGFHQVSIKSRDRENESWVKGTNAQRYDIGIRWKVDHEFNDVEFAHFQVTDYGMEECAIVISVPSAGRVNAKVSSSGSTANAPIGVY